MCRWRGYLAALACSRCRRQPDLTELIARDETYGQQVQGDVCSRRGSLDVRGSPRGVGRDREVLPDCRGEDRRVLSVGLSYRDPFAANAPGLRHECGIGEPAAGRLGWPPLLMEGCRVMDGRVGRRHVQSPLLIGGPGGCPLSTRCTRWTSSSTPRRRYNNSSMSKSRLPLATLR